MMGSRYYLLQRQCFQWQEFTGFLLFLKVKAETQEYLVRKIHRQKQIKVTTRNSKIHKRKVTFCISSKRCKFTFLQVFRKV